MISDLTDDVRFPTIYGRLTVANVIKDVICCLLIIFANSLDHSLDPNCLTLWCHSRKNFSKTILKKLADDKKNAKLLSRQREILDFPLC